MENNIIVLKFNIQHLSLCDVRIQSSSKWPMQFKCTNVFYISFYYRHPKPYLICIYLIIQSIMNKAFQIPKSRHIIVLQIAKKYQESRTSITTLNETLRQTSQTLCWKKSNSAIYRSRQNLIAIQNKQLLAHRSLLDP